MTGFISDKDRSVIPRWRTLEQTAKLGELSPASTPVHQPLPTPNNLAQQRSDWEKYRTVGHALDFATTAIFVDKHQEAQDALVFLKQNKSNIPPWTMGLLEELVPDNSTPPSPPLPNTSAIREEAQQRIDKLEPLVQAEPKDPIIQVDLAHAYATLGLNDNAAQCVTAAQQLAPDNRFVLRSASRFWLHINDKNQAHDILVKSEKTPHDPWLMSAEIAVGFQIKTEPVFAKKAHSIILDQAFPDFHVSELAASVATIDWQHGLINEAKKLFGKSLTKPTENSLAQVAWVASKDNSIHLNKDLLSLNNTYEAQARISCLNGDWRAAAYQCQLWQLDQPFSIDPAIEGSYIAAVALEDFQMAKQFTLTGLDANHNEPVLLNNLAVALINLDDLTEAQKRLSQINPLEYPDDAQRTVAQITKTATTGLLHYRKGETAKARQFYSDAIFLAEKQPAFGHHLTSLAKAFQALEEYRLQTPRHPQLRNEAIQLLEKYNSPNHNILRQKLLDTKKPSPR